MLTDYENKAFEILDVVEATLFSSDIEREIAQHRIAVAHVYAILALVEQQKEMNEITRQLVNIDKEKEYIEDMKLELKGLQLSYRRMIKDLAEKGTIAE
jgi:hypothetical protein